MKKIIVFTLFTIISVGLVFAETRMVTVEQSIRYSDGTFAPLLTPQISKEKAIKTGKGKVILRYDFSVEKSSSSNDIGVYIFFEPELGVFPTGIDGATSLEQELDAESMADWSVVQEGIVTNVYKTDSIEKSFVAFKIVGKKKNVAIIEFQVDISNYSSDKLPISIKFFPIKKKRGVWGVLQDYVIKPYAIFSLVSGVANTTLTGMFGSGAFLKDLFYGEFKDNLYEDSNRTFILLVTE